MAKPRTLIQLLVIEIIDKTAILREKNFLFFVFAVNNEYIFILNP